MERGFDKSHRFCVITQKMRSFFYNLGKDTEDVMIKTILSYLTNNVRIRGVQKRIPLCLSLYVRKNRTLGTIYLKVGDLCKFRMTRYNWGSESNTIERISMGMLNNLIWRTRGRIPELNNALIGFCDRKLDSLALALTKNQLGRSGLGGCYTRYLYSQHWFPMIQLIEMRSHPKSYSA